ncbi:MAG TPA: CHAP domain-containing protein, partial [Ktedonobacteraceae bacterium]|nr:CHAP domain-containing protein [Ktedonobacteraceae bacterium]
GASSVNTTPTPGAVAWWAATKINPFGHVGIVDSVSADGNTIVVSDYNDKSDGKYDSYSISKNNERWPDGFLHIADTGNGTETPGTAAPSNIGGPGLGVGNAINHGNDHLLVNQTLQANQYMTSVNVQSVLIMQPDGNLVLYTGPGYHPIWSSKTFGHPGAYAKLESNGDFVVYSQSGTTLWHSQRYGSPDKLIMQSDGNLVEFSSGLPIWSTATSHVDKTIFMGSDQLNSADTMGPNDYIRSSDGRYIIILQPDNNLVEYGPGWHPIWSTQNEDRGGSSVIMQSDGNLIQYTPNKVSVWSSGTGGNSSSFAMLQPDGSFVIYSTGETPIWNNGAQGKI